MTPLKCNRAFAEVLAASVERRKCTCHPSEAPVPCQRLYAFSDCVAAAEHKEFERDWGEMRFRQQPQRQPRLHQSNVDSAFILAIFLAACAVILCSVR